MSSPDIRERLEEIRRRIAIIEKQEGDSEMWDAYNHMSEDAKWLLDALATERSARESSERERTEFALALNEAGSTLTTTWNVAYWAPDQFEPNWYIAKYECWLEVLTKRQLGTEFEALQAKLTEAEALLRLFLSSVTDPESPDAYCCQWCGMDVNGKDGHKQPHDLACIGMKTKTLLRDWDIHGSQPRTATD